MTKEIVFFKKWFTDNQSWLLLLVNAWFGKRLFHIEGNKSSVGNSKITKIEPNAITWVNSDGTYSTEFRTHAKFAKRLYYGLRPIWEIIHLWDIIFANNFAPDWNLGFDTLTAYPNANPETVSVDGNVLRDIPPSTENWATIRAGAGTGRSDSGSSGAFFQVQASSTTDNWWTLGRSIFLFDTSGIGALSNVISATMSLYVTSVSNSFAVAQWDLNIFSSSPASNTALANADFSTLGTTQFSTSQSGFSTPAYNDFIFNSSGLAAIAKAGISKFGARNATYDAAGATAIWESTKQASISGYFADQTGTTQDPKLVVTYATSAYMSNALSYTIGDDISMTIVNSSNSYIRYELYVEGELIKTEDIGQVTSYTIMTNSTEEDDMYAELPNVVTGVAQITIKSYSDSGYTVQVGTGQDKFGTVRVDQTASKPVFTTFTVANVDKNVTVQDKYSNTLIVSSTATLLGTADAMIKGHSKVRATITVANKAVPVNSATMSKYRFTNGVQYTESAFSDVSTVTIDVDNCQTNTHNVNAIDSRGLSTTVANSLSVFSEYSAVSIFNVVAERDNQVEDGTTLSFDGQLWKKYFSSGTATDPGYGVLNDLVVEYRFKETTVAWGAQSWSSITPTVDSNGVISFSNYINGDLGASGFDPDKSFNIEVRAYDRLSQIIVEITLNVGTPLVDYYRSGGVQAVAVNAKYDPSEGGSFQVDGKNLDFIVVPIGGIVPYAAYTVPNRFLRCDGSAVSRTTYEDLFNVLCPLAWHSDTVNATSDEIQNTSDSHPFVDGDAIFIVNASGGMPGGVSANTVYWVINSSSQAIKLATSYANAIAGTGINITSAGGGDLDIYYCPWGVGDGSTTFNLPNLVGKVPVGNNPSDPSEFRAIGASGGSKTHTLTTSELPAHTHTQKSGQSGAGGANLPPAGTTYGAGIVSNTGGARDGQATGSTGSDGAHNNIQPYAVINYIIRY